MTTAPIYHSVLEAIGNTPLHEVTRMDTGPCRLFLKLENQNPGGSIKDRIGRSMIEAAERDGSLKPGGTILEATAGNTGLGLAVVASQKGYKLKLVMPDKMAQEKIFHLRALGTEVILTRSDVGKGHPEYYQDIAARLCAENPDYFYANQFANPANPAAHETTTGPEIAAQLAALGLTADAVVCGVGSGGMLAGLWHYFSKRDTATEMVLADPEGSILVEYVETGKVSKNVGSWMVEGIGEDFLPPILDLSGVRKAYTIPDAESFQTARDLLASEALIAGSSSGTLVAAALKYCREQTAPRTVVSFVCDSGNKYLSKMYNDFWMADNGFLELDMKGDLRDLIARKYAEGNTVTVGPQTPLKLVYGQMKLFDISQIPVIEGNKLVGLIDEEDLLIRVNRTGGFEGTASDIMTESLVTVDASDDIQQVLDTLNRGMTAIIMHQGRFQGLVTKIDVLNHLRLTQKTNG
ncbi:MAG: pyridoxal-phosphate dependent enzyme [Fimbriimonadaceae bacterium]|nr:pyridoxal-phosphate dependent enzyme [Alphaproteobacteria bacterium]